MAFTVYYIDDWPRKADGNEYGDDELIALLRNGGNPFREQWDVQQLTNEVEHHVNTRVVGIQDFAKGSNNYGIHLRTSDGRDLLCRLARGDVNMPDFGGFKIEDQVNDVQFEAAVYGLLKGNLDIRASRLLYFRVPVHHHGTKTAPLANLSGRRLFVFEKDEGTTNVWHDLTAGAKDMLLDQLADIRAALFNFSVPDELARNFLHDRLFNFKPAKFAVPVAPTREFWMHVLATKIEATIRNPGDMIGWEDDEETVGPVASSAKQSLLSVLPSILPPEDAEGRLYRHVLEHGDYGIHNTSISTSPDGSPLVTSLFDWETACIAPALLADPLVAVCPVDLGADGDGKPSVTRLPGDQTQLDLDLWGTWSRRYTERLYQKSPDLEEGIKAGKQLRHLWFALRDWRGGDS